MFTIKKKNTVFLLAFLLSGCAAMPPRGAAPPLHFEIPKQWIAEYSQNKTDKAWWKEFNDPALDLAIAESITQNHDLTAAAYRIDVTRAEARIAGADLYPQIQGGLSGSRSKQIIDSGSAAAISVNSGNVPIEFISESYGASIDISWELDLWGRIRSGASAAIGDLQAQEAEYAAAILSLAAQTSKSWFAVIEADLQLNLANETVESFRKTAKQAANRADAGVSSPTDKHLALANLSSAEALAQLRAETLERSKRQLEILMGRYPAGEIVNTKALPDVPLIPETGVPSELLERRPDLIAAERRLAAAEKRTDAARAALLPRLSLTKSTGTSSAEFKNLFDGDFLGWTIAGNLVQPIFQGGRLTAQIAAAKNRKAEAAQLYAQQALSAFGEVETALSVDENLQLREAAQQRTAHSAAEAARIAENRYGQGIETLLSVLEGQRRTLDAKSAVISAHRQRLENRVDLYLALGGGFEDLKIYQNEAPK